MKDPIFQELIDHFKKLPGIGAKSARRLAFFLIQSDKSYPLRFAWLMENAAHKYNPCKRCNMLSEEELCSYCSDEDRDSSTLCVVQDVQDVFLIEDTNSYKGKYFVLGGVLSPLDGIGPEDLNISQLEGLLRETDIKEVILALNPSSEGEITMNYLSDMLASQDIEISRLSTGIPFGGNIGYTSSVTLSNALQRRYKVKK